MVSFKKKTKPHIVILTVGVGVSLGILLFWNQTLRHQAKQLEVKSDEAPSQSEKRELNSQGNTSRDLLVKTPQNGQIDPALFAEPLKNGAFYTEENIPLEYPPECQRHLGSPPPATLNEFLKNELHMTGTEPFPTKQRVAQLSQYWTKAGKYFQLSADWTLSYPPSYTLHLLESGDSSGQFNDSTEIQIDKVTTAVRFSTDETMKKMANILASEKKLGAQEGARQMLVMARSAGKNSGFEQHEAVFHNGNLRSYHASHIHCTLSENNLKHICLCADSKQEP
jgi:hypothetical protein